MTIIQSSQLSGRGKHYLGIKKKNRHRWFSLRPWTAASVCRQQTTCYTTVDGSLRVPPADHPVVQPCAIIEGRAAWTLYATCWQWIWSNAMQISINIMNITSVGYDASGDSGKKNPIPLLESALHPPAPLGPLQHGRGLSCTASMTSLCTSACRWRCAGSMMLSRMTSKKGSLLVLLRYLSAHSSFWAAELARPPLCRLY
jgi:hypothetical protein